MATYSETSDQNHPYTLINNNLSLIKLGVNSTKTQLNLYYFDKLPQLKFPRRKYT